MKLNFKKVNGKYFHHKKTDGELLMLLQQGFGKDVIVVRHLYKSEEISMFFFISLYLL